MAKKDNSANKAYGERLKAFRKEARISQESLAKLVDVFQSYIVSVEKGDINVGLNALVTMSEPFEVEYYQLSDPNFPIPSKSELRDRIKRYMFKKKIDPGYLKDETPNLATYMDELLKSDFFKVARTGKDIVEKYKTSFDLDITSSRIADMLSRKPRIDLIDIIKPENGRLNHYILKK